MLKTTIASSDAKPATTPADIVPFAPARAPLLFSRFIDSPGTTMAKRPDFHSTLIGIGATKTHDAAIFTDPAYGQCLTECHCIEQFTRTAGNLRDLSEQYLLEIADRYAGKPIRLAIIGPGGLLQTAILLAKLYNKISFETLLLDLYDPYMFEDYNQAPFQHLAINFVKLLTDFGFKLELGPKASSYTKTSDPVTPSDKGTIRLEFYANDYKQPAQLVFLNDVPIELIELQELLKYMHPDASLILATRFLNIKDPLAFQLPTFWISLCKDGVWRDVVRTTDIDIAAAARMLPVYKALVPERVAEGATKLTLPGA